MQEMIALDTQEFVSFLNSVESLLRCIDGFEEFEAHKLKEAVERDCKYFTQVVKQLELL
jgi:carbon monoxide dehydrogenase subunit G